MTKSMDVIELNGKHYDALTGAYMGSGNGRAPAAARHPVQAAATTPARPTVQARPATAVTPVSHLPVATPAAPAPATTARRHTPRHVSAHKPQQARTLMRHAVRSPHADTAPKPQIKPVAPVVHASVPAAPAVSDAPKAAPAIQPKSAVSTLNQHHVQRAGSTGRSAMVRRFGSNGFTATAKPAPVAAPAPAPAPVTVAASAPAAPVSVVSTPKPAAYKPAAPINPQPLLQKSAKPALQPVSATTKPKQVVSDFAPAQPKQPMQAAARPATLRTAQAVRGSAQDHRRAAARHQAAARQSQAASEDHEEQSIFEQALALATSHELKGPKPAALRASKRRRTIRRVLSIAASAAVFFALCGFIAYQNKSSIQLQVASAKAGFPAGAPVYRPDGFSMSKITYNPGVVATWYTHQDDTFSVIQKKSNWDSQTLLENFVATTNEDYQGYQANGRTVYVYGQGRATWVNGGIWYQIHAGDVLSNDQLVKVAASM